MKLPWKIVFVLIIGLSSPFHYSLVAQDSTSHFKLNAGGNIYAQQEKSPNYFLYPTPEIEVIYRIRTFKTLSVFAGTQYSFSYSHHDLGVKSEWRRKAHELALPILLEQSIGKYISLRGGVVAGYLIRGKEEYKNNIPAHPKWEDVTNQTDYDESSKFYLALFLEPKLRYDFDTSNTISIGPIVRYYIKDNWMKNVRHTTMFGISLQYSMLF